jgi:hypothetical protein
MEMSHDEPEASPRGFALMASRSLAGVILGLRGKTVTVPLRRFMGHGPKSGHLIHVKDNMLLSACNRQKWPTMSGRWAMAEKIAKIEEFLEDTITEVTLYRTPSGALFTTKEEAITSIIAMACPYGDSEECREYRRQGLRCQDCRIGDFLRSAT